MKSSCALNRFNGFDRVTEMRRRPETVKTAAQLLPTVNPGLKPGE